MPTFRDIVGYRPSQAARLLRSLTNRPNPAPRRQPPETLFPGGQIRELWKLPHTPAAPPQPINTARAELSPSEPVECAPTMPEVSGSTASNRPQRTQFARDPEPEVEIDPVVAAPDPEPQGLGARILRAVWAPKAVPPRPGVEAGSLGGRSFSSDMKPTPLSGVSTLPVRQAGPEAARPSKPRPRSKRPRTRKKPVCLHPTETPEITEKGDITLAHHSARCSICNHPDRDAIEQAFLHWTRPSVIAYEFNLGSRLAIYRHAHALGLFRRRNLQTQHALGYLVEQAQSVKPTADSIIRAVKALSCFDDAGRYHEPRKEVLITHQVVNLTAPPEPATTRPRVYPEGATSARRACPEPATTSPSIYPEGAKSARRIPAHSYSIAPVATGDSPIHLKLDANLIDTPDEQRTPLTPMDPVT